MIFTVRTVCGDSRRKRLRSKTMPLDAERGLLLLDLLPEAMPVTRSWLIRQEPTMDRHAVDNLLKSRQLVSIAHAVYLRPGTRMSWESVVASLHYLPISSKRQIHLYGKDAIPKWLAAALPDIEFVRHLPLPNLGAAGLSNFEYDSQERTLFRPETRGQRKSAWPFTMSSPERAYLEVLQDDRRLYPSNTPSSFCKA